MLRKMALFLVVLAAGTVASQDANAADYVRGYLRSSGTYVAPHYRSSADGNFYNNWGTYPNINPYTGSIGTRRTPSYRSYPTYRSYGSSSRWGW